MTPSVEWDAVLEGCAVVVYVGDIGQAGWDYVNCVT